jgi:hypothetical protein
MVRQNLRCVARESADWGLIYFKLYKSQIPVVEQALETAALMLGTDKSRGYCFEMICADFLAGSSLQEDEPEALILSLRRIYSLLPYAMQCDFLKGIEATPCRD